MKTILASAFVLCAAVFFGWSLSATVQHPQPVEIMVLRAEKDLSITPREIMYLQRRINWDI